MYGKYNSFWASLKKDVIWKKYKIILFVTSHVQQPYSNILSYHPHIKLDIIHIETSTTSFRYVDWSWCHFTHSVQTHAFTCACCDWALTVFPEKNKNVMYNKIGDYKKQVIGKQYIEYFIEVDSFS